MVQGGVERVRDICNVSVLRSTPDAECVDFGMLSPDGLDAHGLKVDSTALTRYRARVARPELLIDTDDWCVPDRASWRAYLGAKPELGVPSLYYVDELELAGERVDESHYEALRTTWARRRDEVCACRLLPRRCPKSSPSPGCGT